MPSSNVDLVRSIYERTSRGDFSTPDWADPNIELELVDGPQPGSWSGIAGLAEAFRAILDTWDDFRIEADEFRELDGERVLVLDRYGGSARASGIQLSAIQPRGVSLFHVHAGRVCRMVIYWERDSGLADLGLAPGAG